MALDITAFYEPESCTWSYLVADTGSGHAAIIDPVWVFDPVSGSADSAFTDKILAAATARGFTVDWVLETHAHADHLSSACHIREASGAKIAIGRGICAVQATFVKVFNLRDVPTDGSQFDRLLAEGDVIGLGELEIGVMETPGHTSDSLTYLVGDAAFIGDTLFAPGFGTARCDFPGGDAALLFDSIARIHALPPETRLHLCHDYPARGEAATSVVTVAESLERNIHAKSGTSREDYVHMRTRRDAQLSLPKLIFPALQANIRAGAAPPAEDNGAAYLKLPFNRDLASLIGGSGLRWVNADRKDERGRPGPDRRHWDAVYASCATDEVSWFQSEPGLSLELIRRAGLDTGDPVIDIGGGASVLADRLLERGFRDITVLDISEASMSASRNRLGARASAIQWVAADIRAFRPGRQYGLWHDRALFHFMTRPQDRHAYLEALRTALLPGGQAVIATFAVGGPRKCSGLDIVQYDAEALAAELGKEFSLEDQAGETHVTPGGSRQLFAYFRFRRT